MTQGELSSLQAAQPKFSKGLVYERELEGWRQAKLWLSSGFPSPPFLVIFIICEQG